MQLVKSDQLVLVQPPEIEEDKNKYCVTIFVAHSHGNIIVNRRHIYTCIQGYAEPSGGNGKIMTGFSFFHVLVQVKQPKIMVASGHPTKWIHIFIFYIYLLRNCMGQISVLSQLRLAKRK